MMIVMTPHATPEEIDSVLERIKTEGFQPHRSDGKEQTVIGVVGIVDRDVDPRQFEVLEGVAKVVRISSPFKLASRQFKEEDTVVDVGRGVKVGGREVVLMAGPCTIESKEQVEAIAPIVATAGARIMRGGAFKPRTSPYSFQGMGEEGLKFLRDAADRHNLLIVSEVMDRSQIEMMLRYVDILQVGARNMQNFDLLKDLGKVRRPVLLKRGIAATLQELLLAAEYIMAGGNKQVILCERGIRTVRDVDPQHARHLGDSRREGDVAPADRRRSQPLDGAAPSGRTGGARSDRSGCRWPHHRGPQSAGEGVVRRSAVAATGPDHRAERTNPRNRAGDRTKLSAGCVEDRQRRQPGRVPANGHDAEAAGAIVGSVQVAGQSQGQARDEQQTDHGVEPAKRKRGHPQPDRGHAGDQPAHGNPRPEHARHWDRLYGPTRRQVNRRRILKRVQLRCWIVRALLLAFVLTPAQARAGLVERAEQLLRTVSQQRDREHRFAVADQAQALCEQAIREHPRDAAPHIVLARALTIADPEHPETCRARSCERAIAELKEARRLDGSGAEAQPIATELGLVLSRVGKYEDALAEYDRALKLTDPERQPSLFDDYSRGVLYGNSAETLMALRSSRCRDRSLPPGGSDVDPGRQCRVGACRVGFRRRARS